MKKFTLQTLVLFLCIGSFSGGFAQEISKRKIKELDKYYENSMKDWNVPGMAIAIVQGNEIIFESGYGVAEINKTQKVDEHTMFAIASNTKSFTSAALSQLVSKGLVDWDKPIQTYIPWFKLYNPYVNNNLTVRDMLSHRSGLATFSGDLIWYASKYSREEIMRKAKYLEPTYEFRTHFGYSNILYLTAGEIIPYVTDLSWDDYIKQNIFDPLKMSRSITTVRDLKSFDNVAMPHNVVNDSVFAIDYVNWDNIAPAGSIISNVHDISSWLMMHLNNGVYNGDTVLQAAQIKKMQQASTPIQLPGYAERLLPTMHFNAYGLGWKLFDYGGKKIITHNGGADGMISQTVLIPELNAGFVILTNSSEPLYFAMLYKTLDVILNQPKKDWSKILQGSSRYDDTKEKETISHPQCLENNVYVGTYGGDNYGDAEVSFKDGSLYLNLLPTPIFEGKLKHKSLNTFTIKFDKMPSLPEGTVNFLIDEKGKPYQMVIDIPNPDFNFRELTLKR